MLYKIARLILIIVLNILYSIKIEGKENLKYIKNGAILCANHTSYLDPMFLSMVTKKPIRFMAKSEFFKIRFVNFLFTSLGAFPIKRDTGDLKGLKTAINIVKQGGFLGLFPEGRRVKKNKAGSNDSLDQPLSQDSKAGIGFIVAMTKAPVVPVSISGRTRPFSKIKITVHKPFELTEYFPNKLSSAEYKEISNIIMTQIKKYV